MDGAPEKASAFVIARRPDGRVLCTAEGKRVGVPGGKWEPGVDGPGWEGVLAREFAEEVGAPLPPALSEGYLEWGSAQYRIRFMVLELAEDVAAGLPVGQVADPGGAVHSVQWAQLGGLPRGSVRPHVRAAFDILAMGLVAGDILPRRTRGHRVRSHRAQGHCERPAADGPAANDKPTDGAPTSDGALAVDGEPAKKAGPSDGSE